jgi:hypothetical protein
MGGEMPFIPVPGVAHTILKGHIGANPWAVVLHWQAGASTAPWTQSDLDLLTKTAFTSWGTNLKNLTGTNVLLEESDGQDLTSTTGLGSIWNPSAVPGTNSNTLMPSSVCMVMQNRIAARYRGGHPRTFWPSATGSALATEALFNAAVPGQWNTGVVAYVQTVRSAAYSFGSSTLNHVIPRYTYMITNDPVHHKYTRQRNGLLSVNVVQSYFGLQKVGSQRRRLTP